MSDYTLDFELPLLEIEEKIDALKSTGIKTGMDVSDGIKQLEQQLVEKRKIIYENQRIAISRPLGQLQKFATPFWNPAGISDIGGGGGDLHLR